MDGVNVFLVDDLNYKVHMLPEILTQCLEDAKIIAAQARSTAPVAVNPGVGEPGDYRNGIVAERTYAGARVIAQDAKSAWVEFGIPSKNIPPQFILRRAAEYEGFNLVKRRR